MKHSEEYIRAHWEDALNSQMTARTIAGLVGWAFSDADIKELARLHREGVHRRKIQGLLTECNFHYECGKMIRGEYDKI